MPVEERNEPSTTAPIHEKLVTDLTHLNVLADMGYQSRTSSVLPERKKTRFTNELSIYDPQTLSHEFRDLEKDVSEQVYPKATIDHMGDHQKQGQKDGNSLVIDEFQMMRNDNFQIQALGKHSDTGSGISFEPNRPFARTIPGQTFDGLGSEKFEKEITSSLVKFQQKFWHPSSPASISTSVDLIKHLKNQRFRGTPTGSQVLPMRENLFKEGPDQSTTSISLEPTPSFLPAWEAISFSSSSSQHNHQTQSMKLVNPSTTGTSKAGELDKVVIGSDPSTAISDLGFINSQENLQQWHEIGSASFQNTPSMHGENQEVVSKEQREKIKVPFFPAKEAFPFSDSYKVSFSIIHYLQDMNILDLKNHQPTAEAVRLAQHLSQDLLNRFLTLTQKFQNIPLFQKSSQIWNVETVLPFVYCILSQKPPLRLWQNIKLVTVYIFREYHYEYLSTSEVADNDHLARFLMWHTQIFFYISNPLFNLSPNKIDSDKKTNIKCSLNPLAQCFILLHTQSYHNRFFATGSAATKKRFLLEYLKSWKLADSQEFPGTQYKLDVTDKYQGALK
ncbi:hypothetical protein CROQUDRAFT_129871 [Cronartium quercuum f. sp. fusiforme G11]|uniref:Uncharacterized protein n=1 Tax=Cronartium quercuum f. sp. fusiforme G11 TaxID=708437 RepID=A0A9P6NYJ1_9BASI|nr:hypothetical protein CROQUDRAFT_129871 [Cronartium quercuum f. sp. fusiforme G11]